MESGKESMVTFKLMTTYSTSANDVRVKSDIDQRLLDHLMITL